MSLDRVIHSFLSFLFLFVQQALIPDIDGRLVPSVTVQVTVLCSLSCLFGYIWHVSLPPGEAEGQFCSTDFQVDCQHPATVGCDAGPVRPRAHGSVSAFTLYFTSLIQKTLNYWWSIDFIFFPSHKPICFIVQYTTIGVWGQVHSAVRIRFTNIWIHYVELVVPPTMGQENCLSALVPLRCCRKLNRWHTSPRPLLTVCVNCAASISIYSFTLFVCFTNGLFKACGPTGSWTSNLGSTDALLCLQTWSRSANAAHTVCSCGLYPEWKSLI